MPLLATTHDARGAASGLSSAILCALVGSVLSTASFGCFSEPAAGTDEATDGAVDGSAGSEDTGVGPSAETTFDPDTTADPSGGGCMGCLDAAGGCLAGDLDAACGALASLCVACDAESFCDEGQCVPLPLCDAENCEGCCDGDDCLPGDVVDACGDSGLQCSVCAQDSTCNEGSCELPCETTCTGCCDASGDCIEQDATTADACGAQGETCRTCDADFACSEGSCISTACQSTCEGCCDGAVCDDGNSDAACGGGGLSCQACPTGTSCTDACTADPDALWQVHVFSATTALTNEDGISWDTNSLPDPYVEVSVAGSLESTVEANNSATPIWGEILFEDIPTEGFDAGITIELWDSDFGFDESMGECTFAVPVDSFGVPVQAECTGENDDVLWTLLLSIEAAQ